MDNLMSGKMELLSDEYPSAFFPAEAEDYLSYNPPHYKYERTQLYIRIVSTVILCIYLIPYAAVGILHRFRGWERRREQRRIERESKNKIVRETKKKGNNKKSKSDKHIAEESAKESETLEDEIDITLPWYSMPILNFCAFYSVLLLVLTSPNNTETPRGIFQAPLLSPSECRELINIFEKRVKQDNHDDLDLLNDVEGGKEKIFLQQKLDVRLAPLIERIYGIFPRAVHAKELSIVRESDYQKGKKVDDQMESTTLYLIFSTSLNEGFEGGSTRFFHRRSNSFRDLALDQGSVMIHEGSIGYESNHVTKGIKYTLKGKLSIDWLDSNNEYTGLSWFASWLSLPWLQGRFERAAEGKLLNTWVDGIILRSLCAKVARWIQAFTDVWAKQFIVKLVEDPGKVPTFLSTLDSKTVHSAQKHKSTWFLGRITDINAEKVNEFSEEF